MLELRIACRFRTASLVGGLIGAGLIWNVANATDVVNKALGAKDGEAGPIHAKTVPKSSDQDWWSVRALVSPPVPKLSRWARHWARTPIDAFIAQRLDTVHLRASPEADRATLIRRLYFDLLGLPPSPMEVRAFQEDKDPLCYEKLVDRVLSSPRYGEHWARHWLDVVHYGDSHGYDKDQPRPNAWPYRDYVIRAFNRDKPYSQFVQEQLAGDVLQPDSAEAIQATGFIAAGPWDLIGHAEVPETKIDGQIARHLDRDDMVTTAIGTFTSMTAQCAQCHHHKFDPISQEDYYSLQSVFAAVDRADRPYDDDPAIARQRREFGDQRRRLEQEIKKLDRQIHDQAGPEMAQVEEQIERIESGPNGQQQAEFGYHSAIEAKDNLAKWVQVDLGRPVSISQIVLIGSYDNFNQIGAGFGFPVRFKIEISDDPEFHSTVQSIVDQTQADFPNPKSIPQTFSAGGKQARYVRVTSTKLALRSDDYIFSLGELSVLDGRGTNVALHAKVAALDSIENPPRWSRENLVDGYYYGSNESATNAHELTVLKEKKQALLNKPAVQALENDLTNLQASLQGIETAAAKLPKPKYVYAGGVYEGSGSFVGTGHNGGEPRIIHILTRGDVRKPGAVAVPGALSWVTALPARFDLPQDAPEGRRRLALAQWITDRRNPLTWRSIVNRVWQYHFGRGIVDTPNDFGKMGQLPTHPELLDWLAARFRDGDQSLKSLHRLIVTSAVYRQVSTVRPEAAAIDSDNLYLWRMNRHRLEAEELRDAVLSVSGVLDLTMYGPGYQDFVIEKPENSPHYRYDLYDPEKAGSHRRSIYRFIIRSQPQPFLTALDCADPSMFVAKRDETLTPLQALALLNDDFMLAMSKDFAARVDQAGSTLDSDINLGFELAFGRAARADERKELAAYAKQYGLANACRVILNLNEFVFVD
jgi:hypothetical protein